MLRKYRIVIDDKEIQNLSDFKGAILINNKAERLLIEDVFLKNEGVIHIKFKDKQNSYIFAEKYYKNVKIEFKKECKFLDYLEHKGVKYLYHFTNSKNLNSILEVGLVTRNHLVRLEDYCINDEQRLDHTNAICLSISFPNYRLFSKLRYDYPEEKWVVLVLDIRIVSELDCGFFYTNAANSKFQNRTSKKYRTLDSLKSMFCDEFPPNQLFGSSITRTDIGIANRYTTDPQAEVLVFNDIPTHRIIGVMFSNEDEMKDFNKQYDQYKFEMNLKAFSARKDYAYWQGR